MPTNLIPRMGFERPLAELEARLAGFDATRDLSPAQLEEQRAVRRQLTDETRRVYSQLTPWEIVQVSRHPQRPLTCDYLSLTFDEFTELHGDRTFGDDRAVRTGWAKLDGSKVLVVGHHKGRTTKERSECNFGCAHPEGYRKALAKMRMAAKFGMPVICLIDTPGAYPGVGAEERGQAQIIATCMFEMSRLPTPIICVVIGEGGSGGALGLGVGDKVAMLQYSYYSVISPEGCAGILWKSGAYAEQAANALKLTSADLSRFGVVDDVIEEPLGGAHRDHHQMAGRLKTYLVRCLRELKTRSVDELLSARYAKFRKLGQYLERPVEAAPAEVVAAAATSPLAAEVSGPAINDSLLRQTPPFSPHMAVRTEALERAGARGG